MLYHVLKRGNFGYPVAPGDVVEDPPNAHILVQRGYLIAAPDGTEVTASVDIDEARKAKIENPGPTQESEADLPLEERNARWADKIQHGGTMPRANQEPDPNKGEGPNAGSKRLAKQITDGGTNAAQPEEPDPNAGEGAEGDSTEASSGEPSPTGDASVTPAPSKKTASK